MTENNTPHTFKAGDWVRIRHFGMPGRIVGLLGPFGPGGAQIYRIRVRRKPPMYNEVREDQLTLIPPEEVARMKEERRRHREEVRKQFAAARAAIKASRAQESPANSPTDGTNGAAPKQ